jgi:hypoxia induced protein
MHDALFYLAFLGLLVTAAILLTGVTSMLRGGDFHRRNSNKLMRARVIAQAITILLLMAWLVTSKPV